MALTTKERDALKDSDFAVPATRELPIHDQVHVGMAWKMVDKTKGLTAEQRKTARRRILKKAHDFGMDTSKWHLQAMTFSAMAIAFPEDAEEGHSNKLPFSGVLTRLDQPSDKPLNGTKGKRVVLPTEAANEALASLLGMGVDFTPSFDGHRPKVKIGLITAANIVGNAIEILGFFYAADFPEEVQLIQTEKEKLGFSFEAQSLMQDMNADPLVVEACEFTGAAVLYKDKAAYFETSISANADQENDMTKEQQDQLDAVTKSLATLTEAVAKISAAADPEALAAAVAAAKKLEASSVQHLLNTHCEALRSVATAMQAAGIGCHASRGHVAILHRMADSMQAEAAMGSLPHIYRDHDFVYAAADDDKSKTAIADALKPILDTLAGLGTQIKDMQAAAAISAAGTGAPARKTLPPAVAASLKRLGLEAGSDEGLTVAQIDAAVRKAGLNGQSSIALKLALKDAGAMA